MIPELPSAVAPQGGAKADSPPPLLRVLVVLAFLATVTLGVARIQERVRGLDDFRVDLSRARVASAPDWFPPPEREGLRRAVLGTGSVDLREEGLPDRAAAAVAGDPRVARVLGARRLYPDSVEVLVELRRPVALVETAAGLLPVDAEGVRLPGSYPALRLPRVRGAAAGEVPQAGESFGRAAREGAAVAAALPVDLAESLGLTVVEVSGVGKPREGTPSEVLLLRPAVKGRPAVTVEWGRSPASPEADLDPRPEEKTARLRRAAEVFPGLRGLRTVRVQFDALAVVGNGSH